jgi:hypothetical protein
MDERKAPCAATATAKVSGLRSKRRVQHLASRVIGSTGSRCSLSIKRIDLGRMMEAQAATLRKVAEAQSKAMFKLAESQAASGRSLSVNGLGRGGGWRSAR